jgi:protein-L-isoaspartate O-methyltransferase
VRDERVRAREGAVRRLLEQGVLRTEALIEALLTVAPEPWLGAAEAAAMLSERPAPPGPEGAPAPWLPMRVLAMALEALEPGTGDRVGLLGDPRGYVAALAAALVGEAGEVRLVHPPLDKAATQALHQALAALPNAAAAPGDATVGQTLCGSFDRLWVPGALPRFPAPLRERLHDPGGRAVAFLGPRFRPQDLVCLVRSGAEVAERLIARLQVPVLAGRAGWIAA